MPIHDLGYRKWQGRLSPEVSRWWVIGQTGIRLAWRARWLRCLLIIAWVPTLYMGVAFFFYEQWLTYAEEREAAVAVARKMIIAEAEKMAAAESLETAVAEASETVATEASGIAEAIVLEKAEQRARGIAEGLLPGFEVTKDRHRMWAWLLMTFFRWPQALLILLLVGLIAPPLIARDVRSQAFLLYFSRPITRMEYILGKMAVVWGYMLTITTLPALVLYVVGVLLSPELAVVASTWDLPLRILAASAVLTIPTTAVALAFSSLTTRTWCAGFAWFAVWVFGLVAYLILWGNIEGFNPQGRWTPLSLYLALGEVQSWIFGISPGAGREASFSAVLPSAMLLAGLAVVFMMVLFRRVSSPMRV